MHILRRDLPAATAQRIFEAEGQRCEVHIDDALSSMQADGVRVVQTIENLLNNARKFTDRGGMVTLRAFAQGTDVVVSVEDGGRGIAPALLPHGFGLLTLGDGAVERNEGGLGIGLSIEKSLIEMHGGQVSAHSAGAGRGSYFTISRPGVRASASHASQ